MLTPRFIKKNLVWMVVAFIVLCISPRTGSAQQVGEPGVQPEPYPFSDRYPVEVTLLSPEDLAALQNLDLDIETISPLDGTYPAAGDPFETLLAKVNVNDGEFAHLQAQGLQVQVVPNDSLRAFRAYGPGSGSPNAWPTFEQFVTRMQAIATNYPNLVRMVSIGHSVQGRDIWVLKISDNPDVEEDEPEVKYTSTQHGNEAVGTEMTIRLAELLTSNYGVDPDLTALVDGMEIWLGPIHNPDGYVSGSRYNAHGVDLNRDFPDPITDPVDDPTGREPETQAFMYFGYAHSFVMGANYHTGSRVVNYPWDAEGHDPENSPDNDLYYNFSVGYAIRNTMIWFAPWPGPVIQGWKWYTIYGGMQDWAYFWHGEHHVTIELSDYQPPPYEQMNAYWDANREAMLWWMGRALTGVRGLVTDAYTGEPLTATLTVAETGLPVYTDPQVGDYHRLLLSGDYNLTASADCHAPLTEPVSVISGTITTQDFSLALLDECLPPSELTKTASTGSAQPGDSFNYTLVLSNDTLTSTARVTDTLPAEVTWITGELTATQGTPFFQDGLITWSDVLLPGEPVTITYGVSANLCLAPGLEISNQALLEDGYSPPLTRTATVSVENVLPTLPAAPQPVDGATDQPLDSQLSWDESSDLNCEPLTYSVAFGTENPPAPVAEGLSSPNYDPGELSAHTTYYWSVTVSDSVSQVTGPVWSFTTLNRAPDPPALVSPPDGASGVALDSALTWSGSDPDGDPLSYTLMLSAGDDPPIVVPGLDSPIYIPDGLKQGTTYSWRVSSFDGSAETYGPVWTFTTEGYELFLPVLSTLP